MGLYENDKNCAGEQNNTESPAGGSGAGRPDGRTAPENAKRRPSRKGVGALLNDILINEMSIAEEGCRMVIGDPERKG